MRTQKNTTYKLIIALVLVLPQLTSAGISNHHIKKTNHQREEAYFSLNKRITRILFLWGTEGNVSGNETTANIAFNDTSGDFMFNDTSGHIDFNNTSANIEGNSVSGNFEFNDTSNSIAFQDTAPPAPPSPGE